MKIEEHYRAQYIKTATFSGQLYVLNDKNIILNSISILEYKKDYGAIKEILDFKMQRISKNQYQIYIPGYISADNNFFIKYEVIRDAKKITLNKNECLDITKKEDGSTEIIFQENKGE